MVVLRGSFQVVSNARWVGERRDPAEESVRGKWATRAVGGSFANKWSTYLSCFALLWHDFF